MKLQKQGGYASIVLAGIIIINIIILILLFHNFTPSEIYDPVKMIESYSTYAIAFRVYYVLGILTGVLVLFITLVLKEIMKDDEPRLMSIAVAAASGYFIMSIAAEMSGLYRNIILAELNDAAAFRSFLVLHECFAGTSLNALGWAFLFIGWSTLKTPTFSRKLGYIMLAYGIIVIAVTVFIIQIAITVALLLGLFVFLVLGIALLRNQEPILIAQEMP